MSNTVSGPTNLGDIAIIGAGGIGSWFCETLYHLILGKQIDYTAIHVYDPDVVEKKNLKHQKFFAREVGVHKALIVSARMVDARNLETFTTRFEEKHLGDYQTYIICADNAGVRRLVYEHVYGVNTPAHANKHFLDMRCEGRKYMICTHACDKETLLASLGADSTSTVGRSCQLASDTLQSRIQCGPWAVSAVGAQILLDMYRGTPLPDGIVLSDIVPEAAA
jgi:hypothetical protein